MKFVKNEETIFGKEYIDCVFGTLSNNEPATNPLRISEDSEYTLNSARSWLQTYNKKRYTNHLSVESCFLFSVEYEDLDQRTEFYYLLNFEGRNRPEESVILVAKYVIGCINLFDVNYFSLRDSNSNITRSIEQTNLNDAVSSYYFGETELAFNGFYEFTQHPDFAETVATYNLLNY